MHPNLLTKRARKVVDSAEDIAMHGKAAIRGSMARARETFGDTTRRTAAYVQAKPLKSLLWTGAAVATVALLAGALSKYRHGRPHR